MNPAAEHRRNLMRLLTAFFLLLLAMLPVRAENGELQIVQIDPTGKTLSVVLNGQVHSYRVRPGVETTINGLKASFEELEPGMKVKVTSAEPGLATRLAANGIRTRPSPAAGAPASSSVPAHGNPAAEPPQAAREFKAAVPANDPNGYKIGDVRKGTKISIQYISGKWKHDGHIAQWNPDSDEPKVGDGNRLCVSLPGDEGKAGDVLAIVPASSSKHPFVYEADKDYPALVLRINDPDGSFSRNPGETTWNVKVLPPAH